MLWGAGQQRIPDHLQNPLALATVGVRRLRHVAVRGRIAMPIHHGDRPGARRQKIAPTGSPILEDRRP
ncbi:MAG: hypothetical protein R2710_12815 [Acidimicrobiales bacterium]